MRLLLATLLQGEGERKDKSVLGSDAGERLSDVRDEERQDREKHGKKECATNKKKR